MQTVLLENLESKLAANPEQLYAVQITIRDCPDCAAQSENIESVLEPKYSQIEWIKMYVAAEEDIPLFAPRVVPALIFFKGRSRITEAHGMIQSFESFSEFVDDVITYEAANCDPSEAQPATS